ncbi:hypothetical protein [Rhizobium sp. BT03]|uniref:hypothetical protein n=1 Tax=Rhizobium sp. BT03 TaxID=3045156 RepID=UPI0024B3DEFF|nr:hypothetical protein [Rhizobium sp. BT03]WHO72233.1 hypothetical protein QMO80_001254 [Rhizobium sp. BT03]
MILALDTDLTGREDAFDSGTQRMTSSIVAKKIRIGEKFAGSTAESQNHRRPLAGRSGMHAHASNFSALQPFRPKMFTSDRPVLTN